MNLYAYVMNNPVTAFDVFGHQRCTATGPNGCPLPGPSKTQKASRQKHGKDKGVKRQSFGQFLKNTVVGFFDAFANRTPSNSGEAQAAQVTKMLVGMVGPDDIEEAGAELLGSGAASPVEGLPRVGSALEKADEYHAFPDVVDNFASGATKTTLPNGAELYQVSGSLNGVSGRFEWIVDDGKVTHRIFVPGGTVNGAPIKP